MAYDDSLIWKKSKQVNTNLVIKLNSGTTEGTNQFTFNGSTAKTINITPVSIGAAAASHGTHVSYGTAAPKANGTASAGSASTVSRSDHVHPLQTSVSGNAGSATKLATSRTIDGVSFNGSANITHYGTCSTAAATAAKVVSLTGFTLATGAKVSVKFTVANTASLPTLNVNNTGAKPIYHMGGAITPRYLMANKIYTFIYDGTNFELVGNGNHVVAGKAPGSTLGLAATAEGIGVTASGRASHAEGYSTEATGDDSHAEGNGTTASGTASHAEGAYYATASGNASHAEGFNTTASGYYSHAEGSKSKSIGVASHAEGDGTEASGDDSHAEGYSTEASGYSSHAEGFNTTASKNASHAEGNQTTASELYSHAEGNQTTASGTASHAEGSITIASGSYSHAEGYNTRAAGTSSHVEGYNTNAERFQHVGGRYNRTIAGPTSVSNMSGSLFIIGNGTSAGAGSNAFRIATDGGVYGTKAYSSSGADYAEYFEWKDGNVNKEDRVGLFVTLDGEFIRLANIDDDYILGVVSSTPSIIGDSYFGDNWHGMYEKDIFGRVLTEVVHVDEYADDNGNIIPEHDEKRVILNQAWNPELKYINREDRQEWDAIGMLGKIIVVDDGTCQINGYCKVSNNGIATKSENGYRVIQRLDDNHIKIIFR